MFEAPALVAGLDDFAMMGQAVEQRGCHLGVAKHTGPVAKGQIGRDDDRGALIEPADQMKEQLAAGLKTPHGSRLAAADGDADLSSEAVSLPELEKPTPDEKPERSARFIILRLNLNAHAPDQIWLESRPSRETRMAKRRWRREYRKRMIHS